MLSAIFFLNKKISMNSKVSVPKWSLIQKVKIALMLSKESPVQQRLCVEYISVVSVCSARDELGFPCALRALPASKPLFST